MLAAAQSIGSPPAILIVDDDGGIRQFVRELLEHEGYAVQDVGSGSDALAACQAGPFALVITDLLMPEMDGVELIRVLQDRHPAIPVAVITGEAMGTPGALATLATHLGARSVFRKPLELAAFLQGIRSLLGSS